MRTLVFMASLAAAPLPAQRYVVDATGGGNFLDLPAAVAAVPDGATLFVRPGTYTQFSVVGKGINIIGDIATCTLSSSFPPVPFQVVNVPVGKQVVISGFTMGTLGNPIKILSCAGSVVLRDVRGLWEGNTVQGSANVHLLQLQSVGSGYGNTSPPLFAISGSNVELAGCQIDGGSGLLLGSFQIGKTAVSVSNSTVVVHACLLKGGAGSQTPISPGGPALAVTASSAVTILGASSLTGGNGGYHSGYARGGSGIDCDATSSVLVLGGVLAGGLANGSMPYVGPVTWQKNVVTPIATTSGAVLPNSTVSLKLVALPSVPVVLWLGQSTWFQPYPLLPVGVLTVQPQAVLGPFATDAAGALSVPLAVPATWPGAVPLFAQFATLDLVASTISVSGTLLLCGVY